MSDPVGGAWRVERHRGSVADLHARPLPDPVAPTVWVLEPTAPALVLGSTQRASSVDAAVLAAAGVELVQRRSGGGAVLVVPGACTWIDVVLPRHDPRWVDDVGRSTWWLGEAWVDALASLAVGATVHRGPLDAGRWGSLVCFAGVGPGEVLDRRGAKLVGIAQRRTRAGARFQCLVHRHVEVDTVVDALAPAVRSGADGQALRAELEAGVATVDRPPEALLGALVDVLEHGSEQSPAFFV